MSCVQCYDGTDGLEEGTVVLVVTVTDTHYLKAKLYCNFFSRLTEKLKYIHIDDELLSMFIALKKIFTLYIILMLHLRYTFVRYNVYNAFDRSYIVVLKLFL